MEEPERMKRYDITKPRYSIGTGCTDYDITKPRYSIGTGCTDYDILKSMDDSEYTIINDLSKTGTWTYDVPDYTSTSGSWTSTIKSYHMDPIIKTDDTHKFIKGVMNGETWFIACDNNEELSEKNVLKCLAEMRATLIYECSMIHIRDLECSMTPEVKNRMIRAHQKNVSYGKKSPFIACFDEFGQRLPDELITDATANGMKVNIIDPKEYGDLYLRIDVNKTYK